MALATIVIATTVIATIAITTTANAATLSFQQVLSRAETAHAVSPGALSAADALEHQSRVHFPTIRAETAASSAENVDVFATNVFRFNAVTSILSVDVPLADGGLREKQRRIAKLDAEAFRQRMRERADDLFRDTVDAVAKLYVAQERLRVANGALERTVSLRRRADEKLAVREISNVTAAQWNDEALAAEAQLLDLDLQRVDAEARVKQLMGDASAEPVEVMLDLDQSGEGRAESGDASTATLPLPSPLSPFRSDVQRKIAAFEEAEAARRPQLTMSAFGGVALLGDSGSFASRNRYGLYGLRFSLALPMFDAAATRQVAVARLEAEEAQIENRAAEERKNRDAAALATAATADEKRIELLQRAVTVAREREGSVIRLVSAGMRSENQAAEAAAERVRRESDLLAARVDLWKVQQLLRHQP